MRIRFTLCAICLAFGTFAAEAVAQGPQWGDLTGRFIYDGKPPERPLAGLDRTKSRLSSDERLVVGDSNGLGNVVIYVRTPQISVHPELTQQATSKVMLDVNGGRLVPHVLPIWLSKQTLVMRNRDEEGYNLNLQPPGDRGVNPVLAADEEFECRFFRMQNVPVVVGCNIHPWIQGYVLPRDNPYVAITKVDGTFKLAQLPVGELEFQVWHEVTGYLATPNWPRGRFQYTIRPGDNSLGEVKLAPELFKK